jgi:predicted ATPase/DNA-binding SARP family transcriptional activator
MGKLEVRLLGPFEVMVGGKPVDVPGAKRQALVACLALRSGRVVPTDTLIEALWGNDLPSAPRNAVQHHVTRLRRALGPDRIRLAADGYALQGAVVDATEFEELLAAARGALRAGDARGAADTIADALALWRGRALLGLPQSSWATAEAGRLDSLRLDALEERIEADLALGEHANLVPALRAALDESPFRERLWGQLMLALYRSGRQADALEAFQEARQTLLEELALEPGPELRRLQEAILAHDPAIAPVPVAPKRRGNVPAPTTSFVDRVAALAQVVELLRAHRLVTLTGPPGVGKSRLALEAVRSLESELRDGAWHVDLARAASSADVVRLAAQCLDVRGADPLARTVARLRETDALLVFDSCEHVIEETARVVEAVLSGCPGVRVLASSREVLHLPGEVRLTVEPLAVPSPGSGDAVDVPAVELFTARARAARPGFVLTDEEAWLAAEISRLVDGLPLAIELAAARVNVLGLAEILALVRRRLKLLHERDGRPTTDAGRAAVGTLVEWSYDLLHADEKALLHHVAVHRGGAPLPALVRAGADHGLSEMTVVELLGTLVDKSIVTVSFPNTDARYDVLDTVRDYALERLAESGGLAAARNAHAEHFAALADAAHGALRGPEWRAWIERLELERDNLWAALTWVHEASEAGIAGRLGTLAWYFTLAERVSEGRRFVELALVAASEDAPTPLRLELETFRCFFATEELDLDSAIEAGERALAATEPLPPQAALVEAVVALAHAESGDSERAAVLAERGHARLQPTGDDWSIAAGSLLRGQVAALAGDVPTVGAVAAQAHRHAGAIGFDAFQVPALLLEAWVAERRSDESAAEDAYQRAFALAGQAGFADHAAFALAGLGWVAFSSADIQNAEELERRALAAAEAARSPWVAAHARVRLGRVLAATGDADSAETLYRSVLEWSDEQRPHEARESLFLALAEDPGTAARAGLDDLGWPGGSTATSTGAETALTP